MFKPCTTFLNRPNKMTGTSTCLSLMGVCLVAKVGQNRRNASLSIPEFEFNLPQNLNDREKFTRLQFERNAIGEAFYEMKCSSIMVHKSYLNYEMSILSSILQTSRIFKLFQNQALSSVYVWA